MDKVYKYLGNALLVLLALLSILKAIDFCDTRHFGFLVLGLVAIAIFGCWYGFYRLCFFIAKRITYSYAKVYKEKVIPRIEMEAIERYITEHPLPEPGEVASNEKSDMNKVNEIKNHRLSLEDFMATCKMEREVMEAKKAKDDAIKLEKIQRYTRKTFMKFGFTDEELYQLDECVTTFVTLGAPLPAVNIKIMKKSILKQKDLQNFAWNIANQYNIAPSVTGQFILNTFSAWFVKSELTTVVKNLKNTQGLFNIEIDTRILEHVNEDELDRNP